MKSGLKIGLLALAVGVGGCSEGAPREGANADVGGAGGEEEDGSREEEDGGSDEHGDEDASSVEDAGASDVEAGDGSAPVCGAASAVVELTPVSLAFAFDVSGSMGQLDQPWHDPELKWDPVVAAARGFFESSASTGVSASLTFFPVRDVQGGSDERCLAASYDDPIVPMTALPSPAFGAAIDAIEAEIEDKNWRGGTPTTYVLKGTRAFLDAYRPGKEGAFAIVLVTDGYPQACNSGGYVNTIASAIGEVQGALANGVPTYVIGVENPDIEGAPDTLEDLHMVAEAGGTDTAFLIDTGNPRATIDALAAAIAGIRERAVPCSMDIPPPPEGKVFERASVKVFKQSGAQRADFSYDEGCTESLGWQYDDRDDPQQIVLCPSACESLKSDPEAELKLEFTCEPEIIQLL